VIFGLAVARTDQEDSFPELKLIMVMGMDPAFVREKKMSGTVSSNVALVPVFC